MSTDLCARNDVKSYLGLTGTAHDALLDRLVRTASEAIERFCRRGFALDASTEYFDGGTDRLLLRRIPLAEVTGVWDDPDRLFAEDSRVTSDEFTFDAQSGTLSLRIGAFARGVRSVKVQYRGGYATIPGDVAQACVMLAAAWFHRGQSAADGLNARSSAGVAQQFDAAPLPETVRAILSPYRTPSL